MLTGAGISTESGIPDYRGPARQGKPATPIKYSEYVRSATARQRYWARSALGWLAVARSEPNRGHAWVAAMEREGLVSGLITQNVDGLHRSAGSRTIVELHGNLARVICLNCGTVERRESVQERILVLNPNWTTHAGEVAPDGDVHLLPEVTKRFTVPACLRCGGILKPDVVFFGESVPKDRVATAFTYLERAQLLLVLGSSLTVYSGYRFAVKAAKEGKPVIIVNDGPTRADEIAALKIERRLGFTLSALADELALGGPDRHSRRLSQEDSNPHRRSQIP